MSTPVHNFPPPTVPETKKRRFSQVKPSKFSKKVANELKAGRLVDYYKLIPNCNKNDQKENQYENIAQINVKLPFQWLIDGATGSGKTNLIMNMIDGVGEFKYIYLFAKLLDEPLYNYLIKKYEKRGEKAGEQRIFFSNDLKDLPDIGEIRDTIGKDKALLIVDDMVNEPSKNLKAVCDSYGMGRKINLSCVFLTQNYFKTPKYIRDNSRLNSIGKVTSMNDLSRISKELSLELTPEQLVQLHNAIQNESNRNFLTIDLTKSTPEEMKYKYRKNLAPVNVEELLAK